MRYLLAVLFLLMSTNLQAQNWWPVAPNYSSTAAEGALRGRAALWVGQGVFLRGLGEYEVSHQEAYGMWLDNEHKRILDWWALRDNYKERFRKDHPNFIDRETRRLDMAEAKHALRERRAQLEKDGILLPPKPQFIFDGRSYASYNDFRGSPAWIKMRKEIILKNFRQLGVEYRERMRHDESLRFQNWYNSLSFSEKQKRLVLNR